MGKMSMNHIPGTAARLLGAARAFFKTQESTSMEAAAHPDKCKLGRPSKPMRWRLCGVVVLAAMVGTARASTLHRCLCSSASDVAENQNGGVTKTKLNDKPRKQNT